MESRTLYENLERDFIKPGLSDEWEEVLEPVAEFVTEQYKQRHMGLVCDNTEQINKVFTAVFPTDEVMQRILDTGAEDALLFLHHPGIWDIRKAPQVFSPMNTEMLKRFKERKISIYNLHVPLDNYGEYSTSVTLAKAIGVNPENAFAPYFGALCGVIGSAVCTVHDLKKRIEVAVGHNAKLYNYGRENLEKVAVVAGGGNMIEVLEEAVKKSADAFVTGISVKNDFSKPVHEFARKNNLNILGATHYSTEKFACIAMCNYFANLGLEAEFIEGVPLMDDL